MGQNELKRETKVENYNMTEQLSEKRMSAVSKYLQENFPPKEEVKVTIAVIGYTAAGKSAFINTIRGVKPGDESYAKLGKGCTTQKPTPYQHPYNERIVFYDLPGCGTLSFPKKTYVSNMKLKQYDYFLMMYDTVLLDDNYFLAHELSKLKKNFCLIRTKLDIDIDRAKREVVREEEVIKSIRKKKYQPLNKFMDKSDALFLISNIRTEIGDWAQLTCHIDKCLPAATT